MKSVCSSKRPKNDSRSVRDDHQTHSLQAPKGKNSKRSGSSSNDLRATTKAGSKKADSVLKAMLSEVSDSECSNVLDEVSLKDHKTKRDQNKKSEVINLINEETSRNSGIAPIPVTDCDDSDSPDEELTESDLKVLAKVAKKIKLEYVDQLLKLTNKDKIQSVTPSSSQLDKRDSKGRHDVVITDSRGVKAASSHVTLKSPESNSRINQKKTLVSDSDKVVEIDRVESVIDSEQAGPSHINSIIEKKKMSKHDKSHSDEEKSKINKVAESNNDSSDDSFKSIDSDVEASEEPAKKVRSKKVKYKRRPKYEKLPFDGEFFRWKQDQPGTTHGKTYASDEHDSFRMKIYKENKNKITKHNQRYERGEVSYKLGVNKFADLLGHEFKATMNGFNHTQAKMKVKNNHVQQSSFKSNLPSAVDWREQGYVTAIKDQGQCGSCWAFSATGALEGQFFKNNGKLVRLSEQNLVDCSLYDDNAGCDGGLMDSAFTYIASSGGISLEASYHYTGVDGSCQKGHVAGTVIGYIDIEASERALENAVADIGPISVAIDASADSFQLYASGIYDEPSCSSDDLDHGVLVVGYGSDFGREYWLVKNSWGIAWGEDGYIKMTRNRDNQCGIASMASYPVV